jgi:TPR repeat protein
MTEMNENTDGLVASAEETAREAALTEVKFKLGNMYATGDGVPQDLARVRDSGHRTQPAEMS